MLDNPLLDLIQPVMVAVKHLACPIEVNLFRRIAVPRQIDKQFQIVQLHRIVRGHRMQTLQFADFPLKLLGGLRIPMLFFSLFPQILQRLFAALVTQFVLNHLQLLVEHVLLLLLVHLDLGLVLDLQFQLLHLQAAVLLLQGHLGTLQQIRFLQNTLLGLHLRLQVRGNEIHQKGGAAYILKRQQRIDGKRSARQLDAFCGYLPQRRDRRLELIRIGHVILSVIIGDGGHMPHQVWILLHNGIQYETADTLDDYGHAAIRHVISFQNFRDNAYLVQVGD